MNYRELAMDEIVDEADEVLEQLCANGKNENDDRRDDEWSTRHSYVGKVVSACIGGVTGRQRIFRRLIKMQDFSSAKVGDKVWTIQDGDTSITKNIIGDDYPIKCGDYWYTAEGKLSTHDTSPSLFWSNPNIIAPEKPKRVVKHEIQILPENFNMMLLIVPREHRNCIVQNVILSYETLE